MECTRCGRWSPADRETGYDADDLCPDCRLEDGIDDSDDEPSDHAARSEQRILSASETLRELLEQPMPADTIIEIHRHLTALVRHLSETQDQYGVAMDQAVRR